MKYLLLSFLSIATIISHGQNIHRCGTFEAQMHQESVNPGYLQNVNEVFNRAKHNESQNRETIYTIPIVVHVIYNTNSENVHDSVIFNQIQILNDSYGYTNSDTINLRDTFRTIVGPTNIQFELATIGPDGNPTTGITRTETDITEFGDFGFFTGDMSGLERIKSTIDGGQDPWDQSRYLNIWVADMSLSGITALLGYATPPTNLSNWPSGSTDGMSDGVVIQYQAFGSNNPAPLPDFDVEGKTCVHEVGHYLGLRHIWGDGDCSQQDGIDDTPNATANSQEITNCDTLNNTCTDNIGVLGDLPNMQENYMDYSPETCQNAFTLGQAELMRSVIETERWELIDNYPVLGISNNDQAEIKVFPNPSNGKIKISGLSDNNTVELYSNNGRLINSYLSEKNEITLNDLVSGVYFLRISNAKNTTTKKIIILD